MQGWRVWTASVPACSLPLCLTDPERGTEEHAHGFQARTHTSVAIRDSLTDMGIPFIEIRVSNVHTREPFQHHSYLAHKAVAVIAGLGTKGYGIWLPMILIQLAYPLDHDGGLRYQLRRTSLKKRVA